MSMNGSTPEDRVKRLEQELTAFQARYVAHVRYDHVRLTELELKLRDLETRIQDLAYLERAVLAVYEKTHARPTDMPADADHALEEAIHRIYLASRPAPPHQGLPS
jgi:hypothetical protein